MNINQKKGESVPTKSSACPSSAGTVIIIYLFFFARSGRRYSLLQGRGQRRKLVVSLDGKWKAFMNWGNCLFVMALDGNVKECFPLCDLGIG